MNDPFDISLERDPIVVLESKAPLNGHVRGEVVMVWPRLQKEETPLRVELKPSTKSRRNFQVIFAGPWKDTLPSDLFAIGDRICVGLEDVRVCNQRLLLEHSFCVKHISAGKKPADAHVYSSWTVPTTVATPGVITTNERSIRTVNSHLSANPHAINVEQSNKMPSESFSSAAPQAAEPASAASGWSHGTGRVLKPQNSLDFTTAHHELKRQRADEVDEEHIIKTKTVGNGTSEKNIHDSSISTTTMPMITQMKSSISDIQTMSAAALKPTEVSTHTLRPSSSHSSLVNSKGALPLSDAQRQDAHRLRYEQEVKRRKGNQEKKRDDPAKPLDSRRPSKQQKKKVRQAERQARNAAKRGADGQELQSEAVTPSVKVAAPIPVEIAANPSSPSINGHNSSITIANNLSAPPSSLIKDVERIENEYKRNSLPVEAPMEGVEQQSNPDAPKASSSKDNQPTEVKGNLSHVARGTPPIASQVHQIGQKVQYPSLKTVADMKNQTVDLIGIVFDSNIRKKSKGSSTHANRDSPSIDEGPRRDGWHTTIRIIDPSVAQTVDDLILAKSQFGASVNLFSSDQHDWLPDVKKGDCIVLQRLKVDNFNGGLTATGWADRFQWAIYNIGANSFLEPKLRPGVPYESGLGANGEGRLFSPFLIWKPDDPDKASTILKCSELSQWWIRMAEDIRVALGTVHQIGTSSSTGSAIRKKREHCLLKDVHPEMQPAGFFDCTVEILHVYLDPNDTPSFPPNIVYVTDYTSVRDAYPMTTTTWCPSTLADKVLKVELCDKAKEIGKSIQVGDLWSFDNVKIRHAKGGHSEAKLQEIKMAKLNVEEADDNRHLHELLERKEKWKNQGLDDPWPHYQVQNIPLRDGSRYFHCTAEVLHVAPITSSGTSIVVYVTDYTSNPHLPSLPTHLSSAPWASGLQGQILPIYLYNEQEQFAHILRLKTIYLFTKVSMAATSISSQKWTGRLGGTTRLFDTVNMNHPSEAAATLISNKSTWEGAQRQHHSVDGRALQLPPKTTNQSNTVSTNDPPPNPLGRNPNSLPLKQVELMPLPSKVRSRVRIVSLFPHNHQNWIILQCQNKECNRVSEDDSRKCQHCGKANVERIFHLFVHVVDEEGTELDLLVSGVQNSLTAGLKPQIDSTKALGMLFTRLNPLLGSSVCSTDDDKGIACGFDDTFLDTAWFDVGLQCWECKGEYGEQRVYEWVRHAIAL